MTEPVTLTKLWCDATHLHALIQALDVVFDQIDSQPSSAHSGASALIGEIEDKAAKLRNDLDGAMASQS